MLNSDRILPHYNPSQKIVLTAKASRQGVGAMISHIFADWIKKVIIHAARSLTPTEHNYSQVEKEAFALIFAVKKFHKMLFGYHFTLLTDHKPLLCTFGTKKGILVYSVN